MRIITGSLGGRHFDSPGTSKTHPMSDKMRGALFNILGDISGLTVLDAFAGSGALAFEAVSRGAVSAVAIEQDAAAQSAIAASCKALGLEARVALVRASAARWLQTSNGQLFDLIFCDPPYTDLQEGLIVRLAARVVPEGLVVLSWPTGVPEPELPGCALLERRSYGDGSLAFYRRIE